MEDPIREKKQKQRLAQVLSILPKLRLDLLEVLKEEVDRIVRVRQKLNIKP